MESFFNLNLLSDFLSTSLRLSVPLAFAALAGVLSERSGVFNIALEGKLLAGAFGAAVGAFMFNDPFAGIAVGMLFGALAGTCLAVLGVTFGVNQIVAGIAINIFVLGITAFLSRVVFGAQANTLRLPGFLRFEMPYLSEIPLIGPAIFSQDLLVYVMIVCVVLVHLFFYRTRWGLQVRAVGENPSAADSAGVSVAGVRYGCVIAAGAIAALGGCYLVLSQVFLFSEHMSAGKGFIALAAVILGRWTPVGALLACLLFGFFDALQLRLQFNYQEVPHEFFQMLPYLISILALVGLVGKPTPPAAIGKFYRREAR
ncbi:ABC transporter permease [Microbaculum marinisediminis]|uniref:ABC transporter permease n=1 Tax=Microbaculum marinisediminis TaxID=2931392 RepID=A0AAW5R5C4_9HYPH|nr:ABC transporter permease [Microbaculum sp. A6E488]MCT8973891.1 ABC transporter permease [Microbaculum sp. A6E488]